jgi:hypothetical protein
LDAANVFDVEWPENFEKEIQSGVIIPFRTDGDCNPERFVAPRNGPKLVLAGIIPTSIGGAGTSGDVVDVYLCAGYVRLNDESSFHAADRRENQHRGREEEYPPQARTRHKLVPR